MNQVEIYFHDLTPAAQQRVLHAAGMNDSSEGNHTLFLYPSEVCSLDKK